MEGLTVKLDRKASKIVFERKEGVELTIQNVGVNLAQIKGSSKIFPDKGTNLFMQALQGPIVNLSSANRYGGIAAVDTLFFIRANEIPGQPTVADLSVIPVTAANGVLHFTANIRMTTGTIENTTV